MLSKFLLYLLSLMILKKRAAACRDFKFLYCEVKMCYNFAPAPIE